MTTELKIKVTQEGLEETVENLDNLNDQLENTANSADNAKDKSKSFFDTFKDAGANIQGWIQTFQQIGQVISAASQEYTRQTGIINNLQGSITEASRRMEGLISNIDLMESRNRIAATGLQLTSHEFANLSVAAQRYASASGKDVNEVMNQLTDAITSGSAEALQRFGLRLEDTSSKAATQESALAALESQYGSLAADANNAASGIQSVSVALENAKTDFIQGVQAGGDYNRTMQELNESARSLANSFGIEMSQGFGLAEAAGEAFAMGLDGMVRAMARLIQAVNDFGNMNFSRALETIQSIGNISNEIAAESIAQRATANLQQITRNIQTEVGAATTQGNPNAGRSGGGGGGGSRGLISANEMSTILQREDAERMRTFWAEQDAANARLIEQLRFEGEEAMRIAEIYRQDNEEKQHALDLEEQSINNRIKLREEAEAALRLQQQEVQTQSRVQFGIRGANTLMSEGLKIAQISHEHGKKAAKEELKNWLKNFAMQEVLKGGTALAEGIGMQFTNPPAAGSKYAEAGYHFALAASAGGASAAIKGGGGGGGGGSASNSASPETKPGKASSSGGSESNTIVINVNGQSLITEGQVGREVSNALQAYQARYS